MNHRPSIPVGNGSRTGWSDGKADAAAKLVVQNALFLGKWLVLAFALASLMIAYVPDNLIS